MKKETMSTRISLPVTPEQLKAIKKLAEAEGRTVADYCRRKSLGL